MRTGVVMRSFGRVLVLLFVGGSIAYGTANEKMCVAADTVEDSGFKGMYSRTSYSERADALL